MKNSIVLLVLCISVSIQAQRKPKIKGNRKVIEVREDLSAFNAVQLNDNLSIKLQGASSPGYSIKADDILIDVLKFEVVDSTLVISSFYKITAKKKLEINVQYNQLNAITVRSGSVEVKDIISSAELYIDTFGSSKLKLTADVDFAHVNMEGNSNGDFNIDADSLSIDLKDKAGLKLYGSGGANTLMMQNNATLSVEGSVDSFMVNLIGNTNLRGTKYEAAVVIAKLEASSKARIYAFQTIDLYAKGNSKTFLYGNPKITISEFLDTSQLHKEKN